MKQIKKGDEFAYKNIGYGLVSYERGSDLVEIRDGKLFTDTFSGMGMEWDGKNWTFDGGLGLVTKIVPLSDVPPGELDDSR